MITINDTTIQSSTLSTYYDCIRLMNEITKQEWYKENPNCPTSLTKNNNKNKYQTNNKYIDKHNILKAHKSRTNELSVSINTCNNNLVIRRSNRIQDNNNERIAQTKRYSVRNRLNSLINNLSTPHAISHTRSTRSKQIQQFREIELIELLELQSNSKNMSTEEMEEAIDNIVNNYTNNQSEYNLRDNTARPNYNEDNEEIYQGNANIDDIDMDELRKTFDEYEPHADKQY